MDIAKTASTTSAVTTRGIRMSELTEKQWVIDAIENYGVIDGYNDTFQVIDIIKDLPTVQRDPCIDDIISEIEELIAETKKNGKHHEIHIRINGDLICYGLQLALEIIEEKRNGRSDIQTGGD